MKNSPKLANRYANALYEFALDEKQLETVYQDIVLIKSVLIENRELQIVIESPIIAPKIKSSSFVHIFQEKIGAITFGFLNLIIRKKREPSLLLIINSFITHYQQHHNIKTATLITATELPETVTESIKKVLEEQTKSTILIQNEIKPNIIGGFIIKVEDFLVDASLLGRINKLKMEFAHNIYKSNF